MSNLKQEAQKVLDTYGSQTVAGDFALRILNVLSTVEEPCFGVFDHKLEPSEKPNYTHQLRSEEMGRHDYGCNPYPTAIINEWKKID